MSRISEVGNHKGVQRDHSTGNLDRRENPKSELRLESQDFINQEDPGPGVCCLQPRRLWASHFSLLGLFLQKTSSSDSSKLNKRQSHVVPRSPLCSQMP